VDAGYLEARSRVGKIRYGKAGVERHVDLEELLTDENLENQKLAVLDINFN